MSIPTSEVLKVYGGKDKLNKCIRPGGFSGNCGSTAESPESMWNCPFGRIKTFALLAK